MIPKKPKKNRFNSLVHLGILLKSHPKMDFPAALSAGQIASKRWLIEELEAIDLPLGNVFVLGGWWGILPAMMFEANLDFHMIRSFDIDPSCAAIADAMNMTYVREDWKFKASTADMFDIDYNQYRYKTSRRNNTEVEELDIPDTIINTSCEHLTHFSKWWEKIPKRKLVILQSNNFSEISEHTNCVSSVEDLIRSAPMSEVLFSGELQLEKYKRFMLIGRK